MDGTDENTEKEKRGRISVREVLAMAAENLGREDLVRAVYDCGGEPSGEVESLLNCFELVENEAAIDYFPLKTRECVKTEGGAIELSALSHPPVEILKVFRGHLSLPFEVLPKRILVFGSRGEEVIVEYLYRPRKKRICDDSELSLRVSPRLLSFGVACEYLLKNGQFSEAAVFEKRYFDAMRAAKIAKRPLFLRSRRWV